LLEQRHHQLSAFGICSGLVCASGASASAFSLLHLLFNGSGTRCIELTVETGWQHQRQLWHRLLTAANGGVGISFRFGVCV
jgi:hypothetical protein